MTVAPAWLLAFPVDRPFLAGMGTVIVAAVVLRTLLARTAAGRRTIQVLHAAEAGLVALLLATMLVLSFLQIVLRNFANTGILWIDPLLRQLLLWVGFTGAALATRLDRHINVDALSRIMPPTAKRIAQVATHAFAAAVCLLLANACFKMVREEAGAGTQAFLQIPTWRLQLVMPAALLVMAYRFLRHLLGPLRNAPPPAAPPLLEEGLP